MTGQVPKNAREELQNMQRTLADVETRKTEYGQALEKKMDERRHRTQARHAEEKQNLQFAHDEKVDFVAEQMAGFDYEQDIDGDYGPSLEY